MLELNTTNHATTLSPHGSSHVMAIPMLHMSRHIETSHNVHVSLEPIEPPPLSPSPGSHIQLIEFSFYHDRLLGDPITCKLLKYNPMLAILRTLG
jgi:hypothetical protein